MMKKLIVIILCVCMLFNFAAQPVHAMGAEGIIIGGAAAAGVTLTVGQVALIVAAGFGLIYAATHADEIGAMLESALNAAVNNDETRQQQLTNWRTGAFGGIIALATAPAWIKGVIQNWAGELYESAEAPTIGYGGLTSVPANTPIAPAAYWTNGNDISFPHDVDIVRMGHLSTMTVSGVDYINCYAYLAAFSPVIVSGFKGVKLEDGSYMYVKTYDSMTQIPASAELAGNNKLVYESCLALPQKSDIMGNVSTSYERWVQAYVDGAFSPTDNSICPDVTVGGVEGAMNDYGIDSINIPDINVGQSDLLVPDNTASINDTLNDVLTRLEQQDLTWQQYMDDVAVGTPSVSVPAEGTQTGTLEYPLTDTGVSDVPMDTTQPDNPSTSIPEGIEPYTLDLRTFFPFCIPFDIVKFVDTLCAEPEAPCFTWGIATPDGGTEEMEVDLAVFDPVAEILRGMELLLFIIGLAFLTRALIRG